MFTVANLHTVMASHSRIRVVASEEEPGSLLGYLVRLVENCGVA